ncbi:MAG: hypothetical protein IAF00_09345 [Phycisphaerales bacterium]|nr:hypothetical protein [Phycisphaerales bacterium]
MIDQDDEQQNSFEESVIQERRDFLRGLGKWSRVVIGGVLLSGTATASNPAQADNWTNHRGNWHNRPSGGWTNHRSGWYNAPGGWYNRHGGGWYNRGHGWYNRHGFNDHGGWINNPTDWYNRAGRWSNGFDGGWHNRGGSSWVNRR